jgi:hypothetical protein
MFEIGGLVFEKFHVSHLSALFISTVEPQHQGGRKKEIRTSACHREAVGWSLG